MSVLDINSSPTKSSSGNKRLSKVPIIILLLLAAVVLFAVFYAAMARKQANQKQTAEDQSGQSQMTRNQDVGNFIDDLESAKKMKFGTDAVETNDTTADTVIPTISGVNKNTNTAKNMAQQQDLSIPRLQDEDAEDDAKKELKLKKDLKFKAMTSVSKLGIKDEEKRKNLQPSEQPRNAQDDILSDYIQMMSRLQPGQAAGVAGEGDVDKDAKAELFLAKKKNEGYLEKLKQKQISPYEIKAGWTIPAILITGINSDLPGQILAQVSQNVYDTATGEYLLIPQGTKVVGSYSSNIIYGQSRILIAWNKLIFPNGDTLDIENMQGTSPDGYSGFTDQVDNHYFRIFGSAFLMSAITAGISLADNSNTNSNKETNADKAIAAAIQQMGAVASEMIRKNMNISPTLEIRPGYKFNIFVTKDIVLEPLSLE